MPEIKKLNLDSLRPNPVPMPKQSEAIPTQPATTGQAPRRDWLKIALVCAVVFLIAYVLFDRGVIPSPAPSPDIDADGFYVMVIQPDSEAGLTKEQKEFLRSAKVADWVNEQGGEFRAYPQSQNLDNEQQVWRDIRGQLSPPAVVGVLDNRRLTTMEPPQGIDVGIQAIKDAR